MSINDAEINLDNMDNVLATLKSPMHVSLIIGRSYLYVEDLSYQESLI